MPASGFGDDGEQPDDDRQPDAAGHLSVEAAQVEIAVGFHLRRGLPLEQMLPRDQQPRQRADDRRRPSATPGGRGT